MQHRVVSREEWLAARKRLLDKEKALTRQRDALAAERRALPWVKVEKPYVFDTPDGRQTLADLFDGRRQLIVKHFMLAPGQTEGCIGCSFEIDQAEGAVLHLAARDVSYVSVARAPLPEVAAYWRRMGWRVRYASSHGSDFNYDFHVSFTEAELAGGGAYYNYEHRRVPMLDMSGRSVFYRAETGEVFHTYSQFGRGGEDMLTAYRLLDITPLGRNETGPNRNLSDWVRHHDRYAEGGPPGRPAAE